MRKIGLIAGMSYQSSLVYYRLLNEAVNKKLGGLHSAEVVMNSLDFAEIANLIDRGDWQEMAYVLAQAKMELELTGAEIILLCSNTVHYAIPWIQKFSSPAGILHIAEVTADKVVSQRISKVALLGTKFTMKQDFYKKSLQSRNLEVVVPTEMSMDIINRIIFDELCQGVINPASKKYLIEVINHLIESEKIQGVILGCTELPLLIKSEDIEVPIFDTMKIHVEAAVDLALAK